MPQPVLDSQPVRLIIMAKAPLPGFCNTRLQGRLGLRGAARLQRQLLRQRLQLTTQLDCPVELHVTPNVNHPVFLAGRRCGFKLKQQRQGGLGTRMYAATNRQPSVIIGTDAPALDRQTLTAAIRSVSAGENLCVPADDGGYVLIGLGTPRAQIFRCINWGTRTVLRQTRRQCRRLGIRLRELTACADLDTPADFRRERRLGHLPPF